MNTKIFPKLSKCFQLTMKNVVIKGQKKVLHSLGVPVIWYFPVRL